MNRLLAVPARVLCYAAFAGVIGHFATQPAYRFADPGLAAIKLSITHATDRVEPCVPLTPEQIAELAANMRKTESCGRARVPLAVQLDVDGEPMVSTTARPAGLWKDGPASVYERLAIEPGEHHIAVRLRASGRDHGWDYEAERDVTLVPAQYLVVKFDAAAGGFEFR